MASNLNKMISALSVVPMFAPMLRLMACTKLIMPALTKPTVITVVAVELWMITVMSAPTNMPMKRFEVARSNMLRIRSPARFSNPSDIIFMPYRKRPSPPATKKML